MAFHASRRRAHILLRGRINVTTLARCRQMSANERKSRLLMLLHHIRHTPVQRGMAARAIIPQLALVHIRMA